MAGIVRSFVDLGMGKPGRNCKPCPYGPGSFNVFVEGFGVARIADSLLCPGIGLGVSSVFVNSLPVQKVGDPTTCGIALSSSSSVFAN